MSEPVYKMQPAGHEAPAPRRKYPEPDSKLAEAFENWLKTVKDKRHTGGRYETIDEIRDKYIEARNAVRGLDCTIDEAHALLFKHRDNSRISFAGLFLSAVYNLSKDKEIVLESIIPEIEEIGYKLTADKTLVVYPQSSCAGYHSAGNLILYGDSKYAAHDARGAAVINYGKAYKPCDVSDVLFVNLGEINYDIRYIRKGVALNYGLIKLEKDWHPKAHQPLFLLQAGEYQNRNFEDWMYYSSWLEGVSVVLGVKDESAELTLRRADCTWENFPLGMSSELIYDIRNLGLRFAEGRTDYKKAIKLLNEVGDCTKVMQNFEQILKRAGYNFGIESFMKEEDLDV